MGRGNSQRARTEARSLLYGTRQTGDGPSRAAIDQYHSTAITNRPLSELPWNEYLRGVIDLAASLNLAKPATPDQLAQIGINNQELPVYAAIDIFPSEDQHIRLVPTISANGHSLGIYSAEDNSDNHIYLARGSQPIRDANEAEALLADALAEQGIKRIGRDLDGPELLRRLDAGRQIDLTGGEHSLINLRGWPWSQRKSVARLMVQRARIDGYVTLEEAKQLVGLIEGLAPNSNILDSLKNDRSGRAAIGCQSAIYVAETLN